ncbi:MAG: PHP domain-containing protein [Candidatus Thorarchaeota archaeon]|nr:PHP domain-containing protein [Candidatus Thorarchaeota archaeon]
MRDRADLHTHSHFSDGINSPTEIVKLATERGLAGIALTDHDTLRGLTEFLQCDAPPTLRRVPGIEISTESEGGEAHLLGYFVTPDDHAIAEELERFRKRRRNRFLKMVKRLDELGITIDPVRVKQIMDTIQVPGRPHLARLLVEEGVVKDTDEAFEIYLAEGRPAYVWRQLIELHDGIRLLRSVGAVPVLAHPLTIKIADLHAFLSDLKQTGLAGIEVEYHYSTTRSQIDTNVIRETAKGLGLIMTGGSDYHGDQSHSPLGAVTVSSDVIDQLQREAKDS